MQAHFSAKLLLNGIQMKICFISSSLDLRKGILFLYMRKCIAHSFARTSDDYISDISQCSYPLMHERANQGLQVHSKVMLNGQLRFCKMSPYIWKQRNSSEPCNTVYNGLFQEKYAYEYMAWREKISRGNLDKCAHHDKITLILEICMLSMWVRIRTYQLCCT